MKGIKKYVDWDLKLLDSFFHTFYDQSVYCTLNQKRVYKYLDKYNYILEKPFKKRVYENQKYDNVIWQCWLQGLENAPPIVKSCTNSVKRFSGDRKIIVITDKNQFDYIKLPKYIVDKWRKGIITNTHYSDIIRLELLSRYGGLWIDATVFCSDEIPEKMSNGELFCFKETLLDTKLIKASSWWMASEAHNEVIVKTRNLLYEYWKFEDSLIDYFLLHICLSKVVDCVPKCKKIWNNVPYVNNSNPHVLQLTLNHRYNEREWRHIKSISTIHKLTYKNKINSNKNSFYGKILNEELSFL